MNSKQQIIASTNSLSVHFDFSTIFKKRVLKAVNQVSLDIYRGEVLALVGESGSGKSTFGRALLRLNEPTEGEIFFEQQEITTFTRKQMQPLRRHMQMVFQDPNSSLNPRMKLMEIIREPLYVNQIGSKQEQEEFIRSIIEKVQLPQDSLQKLPHQLSGGQRQRVAIARALVTHPRLLVADEPVSALDVSVQAQIINLLADLKEDLGLTILMISHDLSVVEYFADRVAVMYLGNIVEIGSVDEVFTSPMHPYTKALLDAVPEPTPFDIRAEQPIVGDIPSPFNIPSGCAFRSRCPKAQAECSLAAPSLINISAEHQVACMLYEQ